MSIFNKSIPQFFVISLSTLLLFSCASIAPIANDFPVPKDKAIAWAKQQQRQARLHAWKLSGLVGIRMESKADSANLNWQQNFSSYKIELYGPMGLGATTIAGKPKFVTLTTHDGKKYHAETAISLMTQILGWSVPVSGLRYWAKGVPIPNLPAQMQLNKYGFLSFIKQDGWSIQLSNYRRAGAFIVPAKLVLLRPDLKITLIFNRWYHLSKLPPLEPAPIISSSFKASS